MQTIGGGIVTYVGVRLLPCPEEPARVGQVIEPARIDLRWRDRVVESFALHAGDELLVADGAEVAPGTELLAYRMFGRILRAAIPDGVAAEVHWSEPLIERLDEVTGLTRLEIPPRDRPITVELRVAGAPIATAVVRHAVPIAPPGTVVRRGDPLAHVPRARHMCELDTGIETVRALLDARRLRDHRIALVAPCDATVIDIGRRWIVLRTPAERILHLRLPPGTHVTVEVGDTVIAGEPLTHGERNHHALLHAWGAHRLGEHIIDELSLVFGDQVPRVYWALALRAMMQDGRLRGIASIARRRRATAG